MGLKAKGRTFLEGGGDGTEQHRSADSTPSTPQLDEFSAWLTKEFDGVPYDERSSWSPQLGPEDAPDPDSIETAAPWYQEVQFDAALTDEQLEHIEERARELGIDTEWPHEEWDQVYLEDIAAREADGGWDGWRHREWERFHSPTIGLLDARERFLEHHELGELLAPAAQRFLEETDGDDPESYFEHEGPRIAKQLEEDFISEQVAAGIDAEEALARALAVDFAELAAGSWDDFQDAVQQEEDSLAEEDYERRAAFGEGATVVNVFTGKTHTVGRKRKH